MLGNVQRRWKTKDASWMRRHSLGIALVGLFLIQMLVYHLTALPDWVSTQKAHGASTALWPDYWLHYWAEWQVSVLADTYGALLMVMLTKYFYEKGSAEAEDPPENTKE